MKKIIVLILIAIGIFSWFMNKPENKNIQSILLIHSGENQKDFNTIKSAYSSLLEEEGVSHEWKHFYSLFSDDPSVILKKHPAIIFPDKICPVILEDINVWIGEYCKLGGNALVVYDSGTKNKDFLYRDEAVFASNLGINYISYNSLQEKSYEMANLQFVDKQRADFYEFPPGKLTKNLQLISYGYEEIEYSVARIFINDKLDKREIIAYSILQDGTKEPNIIQKNVGKGNMLYVNLPIGYLKAFGSDDLIARSILRTFLFKIAKFPHLSNVPFNKGGIVINLHIDDNREIEGVRFAKKIGLLRDNLRYSICVTAGDFVNTPGDGMGLDVRNKGRSTVQTLAKYGYIGSHGGWGHNWFSKNIRTGIFNSDSIQKYIIKNNSALSEITGYKVREYAAPEGVHPPFIVTKILEAMDFTSYYITGDSGSSPNRMFFEGKMVSDSVIAFPIMPFRNISSFQEMDWNNVSKEELEEWLFSTLDYVIKNKNTRLIYSHLYDFINNPKYIKSFLDFLDKIEYEVENGNLNINTMTYFTNYIHKHLNTEYQFVKTDDHLEVELKNNDGLKGLTVVVPKLDYMKPINSSFKMEEDDNNYYCICTEDVNESNIKFSIK